MRQRQRTVRQYRRNPARGSSPGFSMSSLMPLALIGGAIYLFTRPGGVGNVLTGAGSPFSRLFGGAARPAGIPATYATQPNQLQRLQVAAVTAGIPAVTGLASMAIANWFKLLGSGGTATGVPTMDTGAVPTIPPGSTAADSYAQGYGLPVAVVDPGMQAFVPDYAGAGLAPDLSAPVDYSLDVTGLGLDTSAAAAVADAELFPMGF